MVALCTVFYCILDNIDCMYLNHTINIVCILTELNMNILNIAKIYEIYDTLHMYSSTVKYEIWLEQYTANDVHNLIYIYIYKKKLKF